MVGLGRLFRVFGCCTRFLKYYGFGELLRISRWNQIGFFLKATGYSDSLRVTVEFVLLSSSFFLFRNTTLFSLGSAIGFRDCCATERVGWSVTNLVIESVFILRVVFLMLLCFVVDVLYFFLF